VAIGTQNFTLVDLRLYSVDWIACCRHFGDSFIFAMPVVKLQNDRIALAT
jgi:hypothetical protein